ncbi:patatin-like phospholipase family protein [Rhizobium sp. C1]|uniref:patatin-like phospholipase family protein n=1 Tax=Rhizobium sp. C1 TaxID=1349799 RepID=UPI001E2C5787|nr:patatin-like phospholipase family protein [Rhizobium sp. C1]MCD2179117.1 patatin-like phospholipase family protein [Rhizobium sp. C1]
MSLLSDKKIIVFQGGGALGAYQAGAYEALHEAGIRPEWIAGISIGAINSAIVAGSPEDRRVENLRRFWELVTSGPRTIPIGEEPMLRRFFNEFSASLAATIGVNGFYKPQLPNPITLLSGRAPIAFYDTSPLIETLENLIDFDLINGGPTRLSVGAVEIETANFRYFDSTQLKNRGGINALHIAASGALPPGFPPIEIEGRHYWDGGLVSNTPLQWIMDRRDHKEDICVFQVDLFSAAGHMPRDMLEAAAREKEIRFSSRTRLNTEIARDQEKMRKALKRVLQKVPPELSNDPDVKYLLGEQDGGGTTVVHLIYQRRGYESSTMDYEFSRITMEDHWRAGYDDAKETLACGQWVNRRIPEEGFKTIDRRRVANGK